MDIARMAAEQRQWFAQGHTLEGKVRRQALEGLRNAIRREEGAIFDALRKDLNKAPMESYMSEVSMVLHELRCALAHLNRWTRPRRVGAPLSQFPAEGTVLPEPYGVALIMSPWNYPFLLSLQPLIGAVAAGNCVVLKPSAYAPATAEVLARLVGEVFDPRHVTVVTGGRQENQALLEEKFDYIFFTGSPSVGREVMAKAARNLTPVTLELGGKSPCIVDSTAHIPLAARRIAFGKFLNAGQTCVAPDYLLVHKAVKEPLAAALERAVEEFFGPDPLENPDYPRIINEKHYNRLLGLLEGEKVRFGGQAREGRIAPTLLDAVSPQAPVMGEEIFGPILPMLEFERLEEAIDFVRQRPKPLALYLFTRDRRAEKQVLSRVPFGGGCVNDTVIHLACPGLPFGGVGESGMGSYHGKATFDTFSHYKGVLRRGLHPDVSLRYHPYTPEKMKLLRRFLK